MNQNIEDLTALLARRLDIHPRATDRPFLIAIDGKSGVGKSTFAKELCHRFDAGLIPGDDFYDSGTVLRRGSAKELAGLCIDRARLRSVLEQLKSNRPARYAPFDWEAFDGSRADRERTVHPQKVLVLEGVYSHHPDLRPLVDFSVLFRVPEPERERRLRAREGEITAWERQWHRAEDWYFENLAEPGDFDLVIGNH